MHEAVQPAGKRRPAVPWCHNPRSPTRRAGDEEGVPCGKLLQAEGSARLPRPIAGYPPSVIRMIVLPGVRPRTTG